MRVVCCGYHGIVNGLGCHDYLGRRVSVQLLEDDDRGNKCEDYIITSRVKSIDLERGIIVTQNTIYIFNP